jgi:hypothetical protein
LLGQAFAHCPKFPTAASRRSLARVSVPVWPTALSGRLPIEALVSRYLTNELIGRGLLFRREVSCEVPPFNNCHHAVPLRYAVLASLSGRYSPPEGRLPTCYSPVRHSPGAEAPFPFDLHVLGTPPALILSQDQTLSHESWSTKTGSLSLSNRATVQLSAPSRSASEKTEPSVPHSQVSRQGHALSSFQTSIAGNRFRPLAASSRAVRDNEVAS